MKGLDARPGELFVFFEENRRVVREFRKFLRCGSLEFTHELNKRPFQITREDYEQMRSDGRIGRIATPERVEDPELPGDIDPSFLLDPDEKNITLKERCRRVAALKRLMEARALRFYCVRFDNEPGASKSAAGLQAFIEEHSAEARKRELTWIPSDSAIRRALRECGIPGQRPLNAFLDRRGKHQPANRWHKDVLRLRGKMIEAYWSMRRLRFKDVIAAFYAEFASVDADRRSLHEAALERPSAATLRNWINAAECYETYEARHGPERARRRYKSHVRGLQAERPLETVIIDHTEVDLWAALYDEHGQLVITERPWLTIAIDVKTRVILAAVLTFEPASLYSVMACLRLIILRKDFLLAEFGELKGATDCWGKPSYIIVDNGWEFVSVSFQVACEAAGIQIIWAPVKTPQFKPYVERAFDTLNEYYFHRLEAGIPYGPQEMTSRSLTPRKYATESLEVHMDRIWRVIVTEYHLNVHYGIGMAPARAWKLGLKNFDRPMIDDARVLYQLIGSSRSALLTTEGIRIEGQRFFDPIETDRLLDALLRHAKKRSERRGKQPVGKIPVQVTIDPADCSYVHVWDFANKRSVRLQNFASAFSKGLSWRVAQEVKDFATEQNLAFHSEEEQYKARCEFMDSLPETIRRSKFRKAKKLLRPLHQELRQLAPGDAVEIASAPPSLTGTDPTSIPTSIPAYERSDDRRPAKAPRRGGAKASKKAAEAKRRKSLERAAKTAGSIVNTDKAPPQFVQAKNSVVPQDSSDFLSRLANDLD